MNSSMFSIIPARYAYQRIPIRRKSSVVSIGIVCEHLFQRCALNLNAVIVSAFCFFYPTYKEVPNANDCRNSVVYVYKNSFCLKMQVLVVTLSRVLCELSVSPHR